MSGPSSFAFTTYFDERKNVLIDEVHIAAAYTPAEGSKLLGIIRIRIVG